MDPHANYRKDRQLYRVGRGEQGVLTCQPYKGELLPLWRFRTPAEAAVSSRLLLGRFHRYGSQGDFVGQDLARKFLQMGFTRARRYANHPSGRKYGPDGAVLPQAADWATSEKAEAARTFKTALDSAMEDPAYLGRLREWKERYG